MGPNGAAIASVVDSSGNNNHGTIARLRQSIRCGAKVPRVARGNAPGQTLIMLNDSA
jgi:hypothetical protein